MKCKCGGKARRICNIVTEFKVVFNIPEIEETELFQCLECNMVFTYEQGIAGT